MILKTTQTLAFTRGKCCYATVTCFTGTTNIQYCSNPMRPPSLYKIPHDDLPRPRATHAIGNRSSDSMFSHPHHHPLLYIYIRKEELKGIGRVARAAMRQWLLLLDALRPCDQLLPLNELSQLTWLPAAATINSFPTSTSTQNCRNHCCQILVFFLYFPSFSSFTFTVHLQFYYLIIYYQ